LNMVPKNHKTSKWSF